MPTRPTGPTRLAMSLHASVRRTLQRHNLIPPGARVLVALSGGPDSVALLYAMRDLAAGGAFYLGGAIHLNHQLRGSESDHDEAFCRRLAAALSIPIDVERADVAA